ncbi:MAG: helix-turn-helix transcriptional regulator [gamma proteobacterium symbiont of Lucinoma myriamae]|nr:helix-turn-helix transcriptional regulator [gamma proteobacterium symbiont of Lucinoma myriamae]MCU7819740.1 helix-turn-helix transcriptional regulator [gamma proteobacterium symbiont of Lucinoma myriamae]MCU7832143.1 helix-turn-helix transcriptional regulator [gamma proteobacterium symbiont of Lucinoma myriamae]
MNDKINLKSHFPDTEECETTEEIKEKNITNAEWIHEEVYDKLCCNAFLLLLYDTSDNKPKLEFEIRCGLESFEVNYLQTIAQDTFLNNSSIIVLRSLIDIKKVVSWDDTSTLLDARWLDKDIALCTFLCKSSLSYDILLIQEMMPLLKALCKAIQIENIYPSVASSKAIPENIISVLVNNYNLTPREMEVLKWVWEGKSNPVIAQILQCSAHTIKTHLQRIFEKTGEYSRLRAAKKVLLCHDNTI